MGTSRIVIVQFLVPSYDRAGRPYPRSLRDRIQRRLEDEFGGWSLVSDRPLPGAWRNPDSGEVERDDSWRYEIGIPGGRIADFDAYLASLAHDLDQKALWRVVHVGSEGKAILARPAGGQHGKRG